MHANATEIHRTGALPAGAAAYCWRSWHEFAIWQEQLPTIRSQSVSTYAKLNKAKSFYLPVKSIESFSSVVNK